MADAPLPTEDVAPTLGLLRHIVGYPLRRAQLAVFEDFARRFAELGLTPAQFSTLVVIRENPGRSQSDIAFALGVQRPNFVAMLDEVERRGFVRRERSGSDRRANKIVLTATGEDCLTQALRLQGEQESAIRAKIGEQRRLELIVMLDQLANL